MTVVCVSAEEKDLAQHHMMIVQAAHKSNDVGPALWNIRSHMPHCQHSQENGIVLSVYCLGQMRRSLNSTSVSNDSNPDCRLPGSFCLGGAGPECSLVTMCPCQLPLAAVKAAMRKID